MKEHNYKGDDLNMDERIHLTGSQFSKRDNFNKDERIHLSLAASFPRETN